ncbi:MAG: type IX secretion system protein PorQ [Deinococcales bacterium]|nr:type IX secretion system protein PorQ [Chitinophagaceae bacterium]
MKYKLLVTIIILYNSITNAQTVGGNAIFSFINQPNTAQLAALGGINISTISNDVGISFHNPALLRSTMHQQVNTSFNSFFAGIKNYSVTTGFHVPKITTNIGVGITYLNYGIITQTDAVGNIYGTFKPTDYVVQIMASKQYKDRFWLGTTLKFINSGYGQYVSNGLAVDIGVTYSDTANGLQISLLAKNIGTQLKTFNNTNKKEELPFDMQFGITKRLAKAPIQFSLTAHHLQQLSINYNDTNFNAAEGNNKVNNNIFNKTISHLIVASQFFIGDKLELTAAYNFLRSKDLSAYNISNGLNGFTMGAGLNLRKLHINYGSGFYQRNIFHQISLTFNWQGKNL